MNGKDADRSTFVECRGIIILDGGESLDKDAGKMWFNEAEMKWYPGEPPPSDKRGTEKRVVKYKDAVRTLSNGLKCVSLKALVRDEGCKEAVWELLESR